MRCSIAAVAGWLLLASTALAADWTQFRGSDGTGAAEGVKLPSSWGGDANIAWKADLPGPGASSPVTWGGKVFVTSYSGYGTAEGQSGSASDLVRHLICLDGQSGKSLWSEEIRTSTPEANYQGFITQHGYASNSPAVDENRVYLFLGTGGAFAYDHSGKRLWQASIGEGTDRWGSATSIVLFEETLIINAAIEAESIVALSKATGEEVWRAAIPRRTWSTPAIVSASDEGRELVASSERAIVGLDPRTGKLLWQCQGIGDYVCPSVVAGEGIAYVSGGRSSEIIAVRTGGRGDVSETHIAWRAEAGANVATPALYKGHLYGVADGGFAYCIDVAKGSIVYRERLPAEGAREAPPRVDAKLPTQRRRGPGRGGRGGRGGGGAQQYASVVVADERVIAVTRTSGAWVFAAKPEWALIGRNSLEDDPGPFDATPSASAGRLLLRSNKAVYCLQPK
jgi:hypothetical protein